MTVRITLPAHELDYAEAMRAEGESWISVEAKMGYSRHVLRRELLAAGRSIGRTASQPARGGRRQNVVVRMSEAERLQWLELGGVRWLRGIMAQHSHLKSGAEGV